MSEWAWVFRDVVQIALTPDSMRRCVDDDGWMMAWE